MPQTPSKTDPLASLVKKAADGDDKAMAKLISEITPAAKSKAAKLRPEYARVADEDLVQEGMIGFLEAVKRFNPSMGVPFVAYANKCIESRILSAIRKYSNSNNIALTTAVSIDEQAEEQSKDNPVDTVIFNDQTQRILAWASSELSNLENKVFRAKISGKTNGEIAKELSITEKSVDNAFQRVKSKMKNQKF